MAVYICEHMEAHQKVQPWPASTWLNAAIFSVTLNEWTSAACLYFSKLEMLEQKMLIVMQNKKLCLKTQAKYMAHECLSEFSLAQY